MEKRKMDRDLAASWAVNEELKEELKRINISQRYMSTSCTNPSGGTNYAMSKLLGEEWKQLKNLNLVFRSKKEMVVLDFGIALL